MNLVPKPEWGKYLDRVSRGMVGLRAEIEVASLELGDHTLAVRLRVAGVHDAAHDRAPVDARAGEGDRGGEDARDVGILHQQGEPERDQGEHHGRDHGVLHGEPDGRARPRRDRPGL